MRAVTVMFDSLNRGFLGPYGCAWTHTPNFQRLAGRAATFDQSYICSMACIPARRDMHTGRPNFLHREWGPLEPFDDSVAELLKNAGVHTHLVTDHYHYWEDGGTFHSRYSTYEFVRGQEGDPWIGQVAEPEWPEREIPRRDRMARQDFVNRQLTADPAHYPMNVTFERGMDFIRRNHRSDAWLLQIETFDPHEPFFSLEEFLEPDRAHFDAYPGKPVEWPPYREVRERPEVVEHTRHEYAALLNGCDARLGRILDLFDELDLWKDTMLVVCTDHGFLLGEHNCWAKCWMPFYDEIAHTPFFIWDPRTPEAAGKRRGALVQPSIDLAPTLLGLFGQAPTPDMTGHDLAATIATDAPVRETAIFGIFGGHVNITDGRHVYLCGPATPANQPLAQYTLMPTLMRRRFPLDELRGIDGLEPPFAFTKGCPTLKIPARYRRSGPDGDSDLPTLLFDLQKDPGQTTPLDEPATERRFRQALRAELAKCHAPREQFERLGLES
jgi:arylsulfatase A-like enzyme